jgi:Zn-dependent protease with chaperone function
VSGAPQKSAEPEFRRLCSRVRFSEDVPAREGPALSRDLAALVGRVRSDSLLVTRTTAPQIWRTVQNVSERLELAETPEVYIRADSEMNAFVPLSGGSERPIAVLNSGLVSLLTPAELAFPLGHELGHLGLGHAHGLVEDSDISGLAALSAMYRSRAAELSADRIGLVACGSTFAAANAILKTASGLGTDLLGLDKLKSGC